MVGDDVGIAVDNCDAVLVIGEYLPPLGRRCQQACVATPLHGMQSAQAPTRATTVEQ